jgi:hypothetical protein
VTVLRALLLTGFAWGVSCGVTWLLVVMLGGGGAIR